LISSTPYSEVNATLNALLDGARSILGSRFVGMYLYGSLAAGDFNPGSSDIDFAIVTDGELPTEMVQALETLHANLAVSGLEWAPKLEGVYVPQAMLRRNEPDAGPCPQLNEGRFFMEPLGAGGVILRDVLQRQGVIVAGPLPQTLIDPVSASDLQQAVLGIFHGWWEPMLADPSWLREQDGYRAFAVLSMCRTLYTLQFGLGASKPVAARWAQQVIRPYAALIGDAMQWRYGMSFNRLDETLQLIRYTQEEIAGFEQDQGDD